MFRSILCLAFAAAQLYAAQSALLAAVERRDLPAVRRLIKGGAPVDTMSLIVAEAWKPEVAGLMRPRWKDNGLVPDASVRPVVLFGVIQSLCSRLASRLDDVATQQHLVRIRDEVNWMEHRWKEVGGTSPPQYGNALAQDVWMLWKAANDSDAARARDAVARTAADIKVKSDDCRAVPGGLGRLVPILVRTRRNTKDIHGWQVLVKPKLLENVSSFESRPFPHLTSPATWELPPGIYVAYAHRPSSQVKSAPVDITIGSGKKLITWDIPVP